MVNENKRYAIPSRILKNSNLSYDSRGFTLVELLVVTTIIGILASLSLSGYTLFKEQARVTRCIAEISGLEKDINAYAVDKGTYPPTATWLSDIGRGGLLDPWGHPYQYKPAGTRTMTTPINTDYDLYSWGTDGLTDPDILNSKSVDDIVRASDGGYLGLAAKF
jgi:general secretion pathway protein G